VQPGQQLNQRGLPGSVDSDQGGRLPGREDQVQAGEHRPLGPGILEADLLERHLADGFPRSGKRAGQVGGLRGELGFQPAYPGKTLQHPRQRHVVPGDIAERGGRRQHRQHDRQRSEGNLVMVGGVAQVAAGTGEGGEHRHAEHQHRPVKLAQRRPGCAHAEQELGPVAVDQPAAEAEYPRFLGHRWHRPEPLQVPGPA
jgi:hypothetical protein